MIIHGQFTGGNIRVLKIEGDTVYLQNEIRDTTEDWFYWAFCVEGAQGRTLTFIFDKKWIGYYGPAVSRDLVSWRWLGSEDTTRASDTFTYTFAPDEAKVYFAHNMLYHPAHFDAFCQSLDLKQRELCVSERGRSVPFVTAGQGEARVILTARHHACEATGSYVLEGVLEELVREPIRGVEVVCVPFVDYDGVVDGDQGKSRAPHDQNRDYPLDGAPIYAAVRAICALAKEKKVLYAFDYHSPWHLSGMNDWVFIVEKHYEVIKNVTRFANLWEKEITADSLPYRAGGTLPPETDWNKGTAQTCSNYMRMACGAELSFSVETPYFRCSGTPFDPD